MLGLTDSELVILSRLDTPIKIQDFLDTLVFNYENEGETCLSPRLVLEKKMAHCIEGAMLAATALLLQGQKPLIMSLKVKKGDYMTTSYLCINKMVIGGLLVRPIMLYLDSEILFIELSEN